MSLIVDTVRQWWSELVATGGQVLFFDRAQQQRGSDPALTFRYDGPIPALDCKSDVDGEMRAYSFRGWLFYGKDGSQEVVFRAGDGGTPGRAFLRGGVDPADDADYPGAAHIYLHPSVNDSAGAAGYLHLGAGTSAATYPRSFAWAYLNTGLNLQRYLYAQIPANPIAPTILAIWDADTDVPGDIISGGGALHVVAVFGGTNWRVLGKLD